MKTKPLTVREVIEKLDKIENKDLPIFIYSNDEIHVFDIDDSIDDRIDLNLIDENF